MIIPFVFFFDFSPISLSTNLESFGVTFGTYECSGRLRDLKKRYLHLLGAADDVLEVALWSIPSHSGATWPSQCADPGPKTEKPET